MLSFHGKDLKAVLTQAISRNRSVLLTCTEGEGGVFLTTERKEDVGRNGQTCQRAFAAGCHPDVNPACTATSRLLTGYRYSSTSTLLVLTRARMWDMITHNHQLTLVLMGEGISIHSAERHYVPVATYRDFTDRMHIAAVGHFDACRNRSDLQHWRAAALRLLRDVRPVACKRAHPHDHYRFLMSAHNLQRRTECVSPDGALRCF